MLAAGKEFFLLPIGYSFVPVSELHSLTDHYGITNVLFFVIWNLFVFYSLREVYLKFLH